MRYPILLLLASASVILASCSGEPEPAPATPASAPATVPITEVAVNTTESVQVAGITLPAGFTATLFAEGMVTPRHIAVADNGDVYVAIRSGQAKFFASEEEGGVMALRDTDGDGVADQYEKFAPADVDTGLGLRNGTLYFSSMTAIYSVELDGNLVPENSIDVVVADLPRSAAGHRSKALTFDSEGNLYTQVGAPSNSCQSAEEPGAPGLMPCTQLDEHGGVFVFSADERDQTHEENGVRYSSGHRNFVALEWNESAGALYALMHGRDGLSGTWSEYFTPEEDIEQPSEEFHRIDEGDNLGWPYTYWDPLRNERMLMPEYGGDGDTPAEASASELYDDPLIGFPAHWSPNDIIFYTSDQFPARYHNGAFLAFHGGFAPRRPEPGGHNVVFVPMDGNGEITGDWEIFADDFETLAETTDAGRGRPTGLAVGPDGSLYIVDDAGGRIWKVSYTGA